MSQWDYSAASPGAVNYTTATAPTAAAPASANPPALGTVAPTATATEALGTVAPTATATAALNTVAPTAVNPAALNTVAPAHTTADALTTAPAVPLNLDGTPVALPNMPSTFIPSFINLSGTGPTLKMLPASAADATVGKIVQGTVSGELKSYQVRLGTDAESLPGIVHPLNFDAEDNPVVFVELAFSANADAAIAAAILAERTAAATLVNKALTNETETVQILVDGATVEWDLSLGGTAAVTLGGNRAIANPTNARAGATYILEIIQDGTGGRTLTWGDAFVWPSNEAPTLTTAAGKRDIAAFCCRDGKLYGSAVTDFA